MTNVWNKMRITEKERTGYSRMREVSELRTQFQCEYRYFLDQRIKSITTPEAIRGERLHAQIADRDSSQVQNNRVLPVIVMLAAIIIGILWILG
jgi:hypothetical protein